LGDRSADAVTEARIYPFSDGMNTKILNILAGTDVDLITKDGKSIDHVGVTPDETTLPTGQDLAAGPDPVLARAAELLGLDLAPTKAYKLFP
jgi:C-terminal processing protease CtpA/Prc